ncbi:MAG: SpoIID/LytB domain-containing protein [Duncaniella sp.]|nr:SpoIID/LytB domain-containing protein [Muribaculum sp.]MCM1254667.1 SpoIID/LytB domain-containing protein [Duncaniella sp.]
MQEPQVKVGILSAPKVNFTLTGIYSTSTIDVVTGEQEVNISESALTLEWNGMTFTELEFTPTSFTGDSFEIQGVTIGINFHWERKENQKFRGSLLLKPIDGKVCVINVIGIEDYLVSVISSEMSATSSLPLLRAHSVISRSWVLAQMENRGKKNNRKNNNKVSVGSDNSGGSEISERSRVLIRYWDHEDHKDFDVCADDHCQRYQGITRVATSVAASAVADTRGQVLTYQGKLCDARFSKCCGGVFEKFENCWEKVEHPYLQPRRDAVDELNYPDLTKEEAAADWIISEPDAFCNTTNQQVLSQVLNNYDRETTHFYRWTENISQAKAKQLVATRLNIDLGDIKSLVPLSRGTSGRIYELRIEGTKGGITIGKELMIRRVLSDSHLYSSAFTVERVDVSSDDVPAEFILHGAGWGHGVGLCQIGAAMMGEKGYRYNEILAHYYPNSSLTKLY